MNLFPINSRYKRIILFISGILIITIIVLFLTFRHSEVIVPDEIEDHEPITEYGIEIEKYNIIDGIIKSNQNFSNLLIELGVDSKTINKLIDKSNGVFDLRKWKAGNEYKAFYTLDSITELEYLIYEHSNIDYVIFKTKDTIDVQYNSKPVTHLLQYGEAEIKSSLWNAVTDNNLPYLLALQLSDVYSWTIDFFGLQKGDSFKVLYEGIYVDGKMIDIGNIYTCCFTHCGKEFSAYYYIQDEKPSYFDEKGISLKKAFLKAPLKFSRISSNFSYARKHPITKKVRPHTGVDYAAPKGTPVMSIGAGTVIAMGYQGGGGNTVKIRHNSSYSTAYLHLSKFASNLKTGKAVSQGEIIGYVGSTGTSTGPHLDFRVWKNNKPVNPLTIESPPTEPVKQVNMPEYIKIVDSLNNTMLYYKSLSEKQKSANS